MPCLEVKNLTYYFGGLCAVSDFNLALEAGELVGIIGPNGAGKTTVFNLITGIYRPTKGVVRFKGKDLTGLRPAAITARGIARTFQNIRLFNNLSVLDNVRIAHYAGMKYTPLEGVLHIGRFGREEERISERSLELLERFNISELAETEARNLPYGMQRRLEIVRALATKPLLLLLDEPAAGMNPSEVHRLIDFVRIIRKEFSLTIILIEHQMRLVMGVCERIMVLDFGATIAEGTPEEIQNNPKVLEAYLGQEAAV
jgi:branched-chain amino acid transport system ATP-binding protein